MERSCGEYRGDNLQSKSKYFRFHLIFMAVEPCWHTSFWKRVLLSIPLKYHLNGHGALHSHSFQFSLTMRHQEKDFIDLDNRRKKRPLSRLKVIKNAYYLSVNVFSKKVLIGDTIFMSPTADVTTVVIPATRRSSFLQAKASTFGSQLL